LLTRLGKPAAHGDAVDLLLECHVRIRTFLGMARRLAEGASAPPDEIAAAALRVHRYFTQALPLHALDEEESILPRLRGLDPEVDRELATMVHEHAEHARPLEALVGACAALAREPGRHAALAATVGGATAELERHFGAHLTREEAVVFPALRRLLDAEADAGIVREIRARRGVVEPDRAAPGTPAP
jgi:iron-sulfur cluster repair protein YtfE (RIC family)